MTLPASVPLTCSNFCIRSLDRYDKVLWFNDVPEEEGCFNVFRIDVTERSELWLEIAQPRFPTPPKAPANCLPWIDSEQFNDPTLNSPALLKTIAIQIAQNDSSADESIENIQDESQIPAAPAAEDANQLAIAGLATVKGSANGKRKGRQRGSKAVSFRTELLKLDNEPEVQATWKKYVLDEWQSWAEKAKPFAPVQKLYDQLFDIHHTVQTMAEKYELLLGVGCLSWQSPSKQRVYRHILTAPASLTFDASRAVISISAPLDGLRYTLEQDMLEMSERPPQQDKKAIEKQLSLLNDDFWKASLLESLLESFVHAISSRGTFENVLDMPDKGDTEPLINLAPAIIFRQRTDLHFVRLFDEIVSQIDQGQEVPLGVERLVGIVVDEGTVSEANDSSLVDEEIYFPLPANDDQREIAARLRDRQGVLVQGPPGTGKSHTIANLVCHLLAMGKRILVTSHTPRALTVLRDKFPADMQALCVSVVGDDTSDARKALEDSVAGITAKQNGWNHQSSIQRVNELQKELGDLRESHQWTLNSLRSVKEKDTFEHSNRFNSYSGTAQRIAKRLREEANSHSWLVDKLDDTEHSLVTNAEAMRLLELMRSFDHESEVNARKTIMSLGDLPLPAVITELSSRMKHAEEMSDLVQNLRSHNSYAASTNLEPADREVIVKSLDELIALFHQIIRRPEAFAKIAARDIIGDHDRKWRELFALTRRQLYAIPEDHREIATKTVNGLGDRDRHTVKAQATELRDHFFRGGKSGFGPFRTKAVKEGLYLINAVRVDGRLCDKVSTLEELISILDLDISVEILKRNWNGICDEIPSSLIGAIATFHDLCEPLKDGLLLHDRMTAIREQLFKFPSLIAPQWDAIESVKAFRDVIAAGAAEKELIVCKKEHADFETKIRTGSTDPSAHPALKELCEALVELNDSRYHAAFEAVRKVAADQLALNERDTLFALLKRSCPEVCNELLNSYHESFWTTRCSQMEAACAWNKASEWILELSDPSNFKKYAKDLENISSEIRETLRELAAVKSWQHTFKRLSEEQRQHLISWSMAVKRIGKGTGKHAEKHRRDAKLHMERCRSSIPAWIMPIHKVVETIRPGTDMFDVIIVDEASQSGPEALFLLYIGKQLVVVGDDKQISPDVVGLDRSSVDALRTEFLKDIPHSDAIGVEHSFFDQAKIRYRGKVRLKEHFRCMPEIIQFSNNLCYSSDPLIPLRQYGGGRLTPVVKTVFVPGGFIDETSSKPINVPEAQAILNEIKRMCSDPAYDGKSIGVISLLNTSGQAKYIENELRIPDKYISKEAFVERNIRVGDAYVFQGDERDIILLSMVSAPPASGQRVHPMTSEKDERRFNVAVSRARDQLILVHSVSVGNLNPKCIRQKLLTYCLNPSVEATDDKLDELSILKSQLVEGYSIQTLQPKPFDSWFEVDVYIRIREKGYRVLPQVNMNGYKIDLIVEGLRGRLAVECDGDKWHGADQYDADMARQRDLERCGMQFWRLRGSAFYYSPDNAMEDLWKTLTALEIFPSAEFLDMKSELEGQKIGVSTSR
jgi:very-short-patch-repair endonuclease